MSGSLSKSLRSSPSFLNVVEQEMMMSPSTPPATTTATVREKQGIVVAILGSDDSNRVRAGSGSLRRTLSADMSSKKWLAQNGFFSPMKKISSSEELSLPALNSFSSSDEEEEEEGMNCPGQFEIWTSIQEQKEKNSSNNNKGVEKSAGEFDIWSSIISQKEKDIESSKSLPPYIHPLVKRSASSLSEKSLEICTESLGSESGSGGFSSYPSSESCSDAEAEQKEEEEEEEEEEEQQQQEEEKKVLIEGNQEEFYRSVKFNCSGGRKSVARSFPPPLPSLSCNDGSLTLRMQTRRDNGRLVMEAVSVPLQKNFAAQRLDGRLVLTFVNSPNPISYGDVIAPPSSEKVKKEEAEEFEEQFVNFEEENESQIDREEEEVFEEEKFEVEEENGAKRIEIVTEQEAVVPKVLSTRLINCHRLALMVDKPVGLSNRNISATTWTNKLNQEEEEEEEQTAPIIAQSLPPRPRPVGRLPQAVANYAKVSATAASASASFNAYEYFWRRAKPMATASAGINHTNSSIDGNKLVVSKSTQTINDIYRLGKHQQQQLIVLRGNKGDNYLVPLLKGCKEPRRTLFWEPHCIATS